MNIVEIETLMNDCDDTNIINLLELKLIELGEETETILMKINTLEEKRKKMLSNRY